MTPKYFSKGLAACEEALQRLLDGKPIVPEHVGLNSSRLTASIVSLEAGFDRGYLKRARKAHLPILAKIEASRADTKNNSGSHNEKRMVRLAAKLLLLEGELAMVRAQRDRVLSQNLQLWEQVRCLELIARKNKSQVRLHL
ncbi:hypothetical protein SB725_20490 [Pseudomonas sp. SIMBA_041]|uniref:hypothetical protein n=1 Tax=Pseudomonas sp. SIMBA_041 TaxID=3085782 RepID=UPI00397A9BC9